MSGSLETENGKGCWELGSISHSTLGSNPVDTSETDLEGLSPLSPCESICHEASPSLGQLLLALESLLL